MAAGFSAVRQYIGWLIFINIVTSKIKFHVLLGGGGGFMEKRHSDVFRSKIDLWVAPWNKKGWVFHYDRARKEGVLIL